MKRKLLWILLGLLALGMLTAALLGRLLPEES